MSRLSYWLYGSLVGGSELEEVHLQVQYQEWRFWTEMVSRYELHVDTYTEYLLLGQQSQLCINQWHFSFLSTVDWSEWFYHVETEDVSQPNGSGCE